MKVLLTVLILSCCLKGGVLAADTVISFNLTTTNYVYYLWPIKLGTVIPQTFNFSLGTANDVSKPLCETDIVHLCRRQVLQ